MSKYAVIKVVRFGINLACFSDAYAVELVEKQIVKQKKRLELEDLEPEITFFNAGSDY